MNASNTLGRGAGEPPESSLGGSLATMLMEELLLIGLLVLLVGTLFSDAYYDVFGIQHQFLQLPTSYYVYRGLTAIASYPWLATPYLLSAIIMLAIHGQPGTSTPSHPSWRLRASLWRERLLSHRKKLLYLSTLFLVMTAIPLAQLAGQHKARKDLRDATSTLPTIAAIKVTDDQRLSDWLLMSEPPARLLFTGPQFTVLFVPLTSHRNKDANAPLTFFISNEKLESLKLDSHTRKEQPHELSNRQGARAPLRPPAGPEGARRYRQEQWQ